MKNIYKFYLFMPYDEMRDMDIKYNRTSKFFYNENSDMCFVLYAWTNNKNIKNEFARLRTERFIIKEQKIDSDSEYQDFKVHYKEEKIEPRPLRYYNENKEKYEDIDVLMTFSEHVLFSEFLEEFAGSVMSKYCESEYQYLKEEFIEILDLFMYTTYHDIYYAEDESVEDLVAYQLSFRKTVRGHDVDKIISTMDQFKLFVHTFTDLFK